MRARVVEVTQSLITDFYPVIRNGVPSFYFWEKFHGRVNGVYRLSSGCYRVNYLPTKPLAQTLIVQYFDVVWIFVLFCFILLCLALFVFNKIVTAAFFYFFFSCSFFCFIVLAHAKFVNENLALANSIKKSFIELVHAKFSLENLAWANSNTVNIWIPN